MEAIYKLHFDCGRQGTIYAVFIANKEEVDHLVETGYEVYFGEVLGKHSEISGPLVPKTDFTMVSDNPEDVKVVRRLNLTFGHNPIKLWKESEGL